VIVPVASMDAPLGLGGSSHSLPAVDGCPGVVLRAAASCLVFHLVFQVSVVDMMPLRAVLSYHSGYLVVGQGDFARNRRVLEV
jgi:hypothetical protein